MRMLDVCSGIGGFSIAGGWAGFEAVAFCEIDPFCRRVLAYHWPGVPIYDDIRCLSVAALRERGIEPGIDLFTAGFPCQPFSVAGKRLGAADDRHLWPEVCRVIGEVRPRWVCLENVTGLIRLGLDDVLADLEAIGYATGTVVLPACAVGGPHIRERVFVVAHADGDGQLQPGRRIEEQRRRTGDGAQAAGHAADTDGQRPARRAQQPAGLREAARIDADSDGINATPRLGDQPDGQAALSPDAGSGAAFWLAPDGWPDPMGDGVPRGMVEDALGALGNALVPQQVYPVLAAIAAHERQEATR